LETVDFPEPDGPSRAMTTPTWFSFPSTTTRHPRRSKATARRIVSCGSTESKEAVAEGSQVTGYFVEGIGTPELKVGATLQKLTYTLGILHTGELDEDTSLPLETLEVRRYDPEAVDTCAQDIERGFDGTVVLLLQEFDHLGFRGGRVDLIAKVASPEDQSKVNAW